MVLYTRKEVTLSGLMDMGINECAAKRKIITGSILNDFKEINTEVFLICKFIEDMDEQKISEMFNILVDRGGLVVH